MRRILSAIGERMARVTRPSRPYLRDLMLAYQTKNLDSENPENFRAKIDQFLTLRDYHMERLESPVTQRDLTVAFQWGHDHDFGTFKLKGEMQDRHIRHLSEFIDAFEAIPRSLNGMKVLDIGCWTGGTSLLMCAMGAQVLAIDEVKKYVDCLGYLRDAFSIQTLEVQHRSLYELTAAEFQDRFDLVLFAGVLYHVTDPIVALRITFNCLHDGGKCLIETTGFRRRQSVISFARRKWNWFDLSPRALRQMMADVGYAEIQLGKISLYGRLHAVGRRVSHVPMRRDGLSLRSLR